MPSSVILHIDYDAATQNLKVKFVSGKTYGYQNVPPKVYEAFKTAGSKGVYFNLHIKNAYKFKRLSESNKENQKTHHPPGKGH